MSDRPNNPNNEETGSQSAWHSPRDASPWQATDTQTQAAVSWQEVKALPDDVDKQPTQRGVWHIPDDSDTLFTSDDVLEVTNAPRKAPTTSSIPAARPEDLIAEILGGSQKVNAVPNPEDFDYSGGVTTDADAVQEGDTLLVDEEDLSSTAEALPDLDMDDEDFSMTEYLALASLAQGDDDDLAGIQSDDLSPAERVLYGAALNVADEMDSKRVPDDATVTLQDTGEVPASQAQDYAAQQLAKLQEQQSGGTAPYETQGTQGYQAPQQRQYTPEEIQLANQFRETKREVAVLRQMRDAGQIDQNALSAQLQQHQIYANDVWWMIGLDSDEWYRYNDQIGDWEQSAPPVPLDAGQARTETGLGSVAPDVQEASLPYLPNDGTQNTGEFSQDTNYENYDQSQYVDAQQAYTEQYGVSDNTVPYTNQPVVDPNLTQVGGAVDLTHLSYADPTVQNLDIVDQSTIQSDLHGGQNTVPSASIGDMAYNDGYANQNIPPADPGFQDSGFNDYNAQAAPTIDEIQNTQDGKLLAVVGFSVFGLLIFALILFGGFVLFAMNQYNSIVDEWQDEITGLVDQGFDFQTATILAADGSQIAELTGEEGERTVVSIEDGDVSPFFIHAIVASEDPRFYENPGFDVVAIGRAFLQNFFAGEVTSGASTITQQIVRERILGSNVVSFDRKLTEVLLSMEVARTYSKTEILEIYINEFFYGEQSYGVEAAADFYFDTPAKELNAAQAATLAGILPSPSSTNPVVAPAATFDNMRVILNRMVDADCLNFQHGEWAQTNRPFCINETILVDNGSGGQVSLYTRNPDGTFGGFLAFQMAQVETRRYEPRQTDIQYPHFVFYVLGELDAAYGRGAYIERGFTVQTTLIPRIQNTAEAAIRQGVDNLTARGAQTGAAIVIDPRTGAIVSMVGSPDFNDENIDGQNNNTISYQQPGSAIKPIVYATSLRGTLENGYYTPASILWDVPSQYQIDATSPPYEPVNFDGRYRGPVPVRYALAQSLNIPAVKTYAQFGTQAFVDTAAAMGITFDPDPTDDVNPIFGLPTAIGATEVSLMDLTNAYATIANDGMRNELYVVDTITERDTSGRQVPVELAGTLLHGQQSQAITPQVAYLLQSILSDDTARTGALNGMGSTFPANSPLSGAHFGLNNRDQVAAKTGTNNTVGGNPSRIWTVGFTNNYAVGVWMGTLNQGTPMNGNVTGFTGASPVWAAIMSETINGVNPGTFDNPGDVLQETICRLTGTLADENTSCPAISSEFYVRSQPHPPASDGFVATISIDSWTGMRANQSCNVNVITENFANFSDPFATNWLNGTAGGQQILATLGLPSNLQAPPTAECQQGQVIPNIFMNFPNENAQLLGNVAVTGQISATELQRWEIQISEVGTDNFRSVMPQASTNQMQVNGSVLYDWDSTTVPNGAYILRLAAYSNINGGFIFRETRVTVQNPQPTPLPPSPTPFTVIVETPLPFDLPTATP